MFHTNEGGCRKVLNFVRIYRRVRGMRVCGALRGPAETKMKYLTLLCHENLKKTKCFKQIFVWL